MHIKRQLGKFPDIRHHFRSECNVGHEVAIHHVDVDVVCARLLNRGHLRREPPKISRQDGRGDPYREHAVSYHDHARLVCPGRSCNETATRLASLSLWLDLALEQIRNPHVERGRHLDQARD